MRHVYVQPLTLHCSTLESESDRTDVTINLGINRAPQDVTTDGVVANDQVFVDGKRRTGSILREVFMLHYLYKTFITLDYKVFVGLSHVEIDIGASKLVSVSPHQLQEW